MRLKRNVAGAEEMQFCTWNVTLERAGSELAAQGALWGFGHTAEPATAARIISMTGSGAVTNGAWSTFSDLMRATMRSAMKS